MELAHKIVLYPTAIFVLAMFVKYVLEDSLPFQETVLLVTSVTAKYVKPPTPVLLA